jgi:hypothetical protein
LNLTLNGWRYECVSLGLDYRIHTGRKELVKNLFSKIFDFNKILRLSQCEGFDHLLITEIFKRDSFRKIKKIIKRSHANNVEFYNNSESGKDSGYEEEIYKLRRINERINEEIVEKIFDWLKTAAKIRELGQRHRKYEKDVNKEEVYSRVEELAEEIDLDVNAVKQIFSTIFLLYQHFNEDCLK